MNPTNISGRINIFVDDNNTISIHDKETKSDDAGLTTPNVIYIQGVKTYGKIWGGFLAAFGYASKLDGDIYVNTRSFFQHFVESWCKKDGQLQTTRVYINQIAENIEKNKKIDKHNLTAGKIREIFNNRIAYGTVATMSTPFDTKKLFEK